MAKDVTSHLYKDFAPLLNNIRLMFQVVFGGLTDVYLHALLRQTHIQKTTAKAERSNRSSVFTETISNYHKEVKTFGLMDSKMGVHSEFSTSMRMHSEKIPSL